MTILSKPKTTQLCLYCNTTLVPSKRSNLGQCPLPVSAADVVVNSGCCVTGDYDAGPLHLSWVVLTVIQTDHLITLSL